MKIALLTDGITPYVTGGMQRHSFNLCRYLASRKIHVDLYHCDPMSRGAASLNCFTEEEKLYISSHLIEFPSFGKMFGHYIRESYEYSQRILKRLRSNAQVDFIYAKGFTAWELLNLKSKGEEFPPVGVNFHGYEMFQRQPDFRHTLSARFLLSAPVDFNIRHADFVFSYGGKITQIIRSRGIPDARIIEIPAAIGTEWLQQKGAPVHQPVRVLFVGRDERRKGLKELNSAIRMLTPAERKKVQFSFLGPVKATNKVAGCEYHGEVSDAGAIQKIYAANDVLILPSYSEGMPNVVLEAMGSGLAVIASDVGAVSLMVDEQNGWLIRNVTAKAVHAALQQLLQTNSSTVTAKKEASLRRAAQFTWEHIGQRTVDSIAAAVTRG
jgi:glycosyltransferase involved in cell wall biosynthesis